MEMTLQNIYFLVGAAGFLLAAICAISAVAYFLRADIRGVLADLSGKTRSAELAEFTMPKRGRGSKKSVLTDNDEWTGGIAQGDLAAQSGSDAITEDPSLSGPGSGSGSGASSDWSYSDSVERDQVLDSGSSAETFSIVRQIVSVHSASAIDEQGNEVPLGSLSGGAR